MVVEPLEDGVYAAMVEGNLPSSVELKKKNVALAKDLEKYGMDYDEASAVRLIHNKNVFIDRTKGVQYLNEVMEMVKDAFKSMMDEGPLCREPCTKVKVTLLDADLHEDPVHRGPGQIIPAIRGTVRDGMLYASASLLEPKQVIRIDVPTDLIGEATREVENRRGQILDVQEERGATVVKAKLPVSDMFGLDASLKTSTSGRGFYSMIEVSFERLPTNMRDKVVMQIRKRKGLEEKVPTAAGGEAGGE
jgi:elongation factor 2